MARNLTFSRLEYTGEKLAKLRNFFNIGGKLIQKLVENRSKILRPIFDQALKKKSMKVGTQSQLFYLSTIKHDFLINVNENGKIVNDSDRSHKIFLAPFPHLSEVLSKSHSSYPLKRIQNNLSPSHIINELRDKSSFYPVVFRFLQLIYNS